MAGVMWAIFRVVALLLAAVVVAVTLLPMFRSGNWVVQAAEFPRLQILGLAGVTAALLVACVCGARGAVRAGPGRPPGGCWWLRRL